MTPREESHMELSESIEMLDLQTDKPLPYHRIKSVEVQGGFLDGLKMDFNDYLNCLIGGRGTGKTTILELLRYGLDKMPDPFFYEEKLKALDSLIQGNMGGGVVKIAVETRDGQTLLIERRAGDEATTVRNAEGEQLEFSADRGILFNAEIYSQDEIEEIAKNPMSQLEIIDKFAAQELGEIQDQIQASMKGLDANAAETLRLISDMEMLKKKLAGLPEIIERLKAFALEGGEKTQVLRQEIAFKAIRDKEKRLTGDLKELFESCAAEARTLAEGLTARFQERFDPEVLKGQNKDLMAQCKDECGKAADSAAEALLKGASALAGAETRLGQLLSSLSARHLAQEKHYREVLGAHEQEKAKAQERERLVKRQNELLLDKKKSDALAATLKKRKEERAKLMASLSDLRDKRYHLRETVAARLNEALCSAVRIKVDEFGNTEPYAQLLMAALKGSELKYKRIVDKAVRTVPPERLAAWIETQDEASLSKKLEIDADQTRKIIAAFQGKKELYDLQTVELPDRPVIELKDGQTYKESGLLSTGQRCSTILPILLLRSENPLVIDQPENNLDNAFIYDNVVMTLRKMKGKRQFIFVTHNPNIPVLGNAPNVVVMKADGQKGWKDGEGDVDAMREPIENLLEGGKDAFKERYHRYGY